MQTCSGVLVRIRVRQRCIAITDNEICYSNYLEVIQAVPLSWGWVLQLMLAGVVKVIVEFPSRTCSREKLLKKRAVVVFKAPD